MQCPHCYHEMELVEIDGESYWYCDLDELNLSMSEAAVMCEEDEYDADDSFNFYGGVYA